MKKGFFSIKKERVFLYLFLSLFLFCIDFSSKYWIYHHLGHFPFFGVPHEEIKIFHNVFGIDFFITPVLNKGSAWGLFSSFPSFLLIVRSLLIGVLFFYAVFFNKRQERDLPLLLILTGALGNVVDGFLYGSVVDMFHFIFWGYSYPVFNVADSLIFIGIVSLILQMFYAKRKQKYVY